MVLAKNSVRCSLVVRKTVTAARSFQGRKNIFSFLDLDLRFRIGGMISPWECLLSIRWERFIVKRVANKNSNSKTFYFSKLIKLINYIRFKFWEHLWFFFDSFWIFQTVFLALSIFECKFSKEKNIFSFSGLLIVFFDSL